MIKRLARCVREYKWPALLSPLCMVGEVAMEVIIPLVMASLYDYGIQEKNMEIIVSRSILLVVLALASLAFGVLSAVFASKASTGFAKNLRHDMYHHIQNFSFSNIDKFSTASIVTRLTSDVAQLQMAFQMMIRMTIRCTMMLALALVMALALCALYLLALGRRPVRRVAPGAAAALVAWMAISTVFSYYVEHLADYTRLYGSVTAVVVTLLWLYMSAMVLILGAELNAVLRRKR